MKSVKVSCKILPGDAGKQARGQRLTRILLSPSPSGLLQLYTQVSDPISVLGGSDNPSQESRAFLIGGETPKAPAQVWLVEST